MTLPYIRHGDLLLVPLEHYSLTEMPEGTATGNNILAEGEATGHHHILTGEAKVFNVSIPQHPEITKAVEIVNDQSIVHEEHKEVKVPAGKYVLVQERELTLEQEARRVLD